MAPEYIIIIYKAEFFSRIHILDVIYISISLE